MNAKNLIHHFARVAGVFMVTLLVLLLVVAVQSITIELAYLFWTATPASSTEPKQELTPEQARTQRILRAKKEFLPDGTLHLVTQITGNRWQPAYGSYPSDALTGQEQVYDVNDKLLWDGPAKERPYNYLSWAQAIRDDGFTRERMKHHQQFTEPRVLEIPVGTPDELLEIWRYDSWADCFVGYSLQGGRVGYLSAAGWTDSKADVRPFGPFQSFQAWWPPDSHSPTLLWQTEQCIYEIGFASRQADRILESPQGRIEYVAMNPSYRFRQASGETMARTRPWLHCRTSDGVHHLILKDPDQTITVATPPEWKQWYGNHCEFAATKEGVFLRRTWLEYPAPAARGNPDWWTGFRRAPKNQSVELYRVDETGGLDLVNRYSWTLPGDPGAIQYVEPRSHVKRFVTAFSPFLYDLFWLPFPAGFQHNLYERSDFACQFIEAVEEMRPRFSVWSWLVTGAMLALTFRHGRPRRTSWGRLVFWLVFVALLNVAGFLVYWALNHAPTMACPACGKRRGLNRIDCVHCRAALPTPEHGKLDLIFSV
ncbi:MAG TPA: hypothetical protein PLU87_08430 [Sedimentisphaerales bacterium]|nr:hypothetical protein [Sedimentisphaerales bacterium]HRS10812.1 hypothetical protein [Sedimentisphaerales bacterium]HRV47518.1 hypothetical protein [Sedimentisphaerales bacterium]